MGEVTFSWKAPAGKDPTRERDATPPQGLP
jgi:hypothetical protein